MNGTQRKPRTRGLRVTLVVLCVVLGMVAAPMAVTAQNGAPPEPPHRVYGDVVDGDGDVVADTTVAAVYDGETIATTETDEDGYYDFQVSSEDTELGAGDDVTITVGDASDTIAWESAGTDRLDFTVDAEAPPVDDPVDEGDSPVDDDGNADVELGDGDIGSVGVSGLPAAASTVTVYESTSPTDNAPEPGQTVAVYLDIGADVDVTSDVDVSVTVDASALDDAGIDTGDAVLLHYTDGSWSELETDVTDNNGDVTLEATASGLSPFAVAQADTDDGGSDGGDDGGDGNTGGGGGGAGGGGGGGGGSDTTTTTTTPTSTSTTTTPTDTTTQTSTPTSTATDDGPTDDGPTDTTTTTSTPPPEEDDGPGALFIGGLLVVVLAVAGALYMVYGRE